MLRSCFGLNVLINFAKSLSSNLVCGVQRRKHTLETETPLYRYANFRCHQWREIYHHDDSFFFMIVTKNHTCDCGCSRRFRWNRICIWWYPQIIQAVRKIIYLTFDKIILNEWWIYISASVSNQIHIPSASFIGRRMAVIASAIRQSFY